MEFRTKENHIPDVSDLHGILHCFLFERNTDEKYFSLIQLENGARRMF